MKTGKILGILCISLFAISSISCTKDITKHLHFTQNEIIGDIISENQIPLKTNNITAYYQSSTTINIRGNKGECSAVSSNEEVADFTIYDGDKKSITIYGHKPGNATITVKDAAGQTATLHVSVEYWEQNWEVEKYEVVVTGELLTEAEIKEIEKKALSSVPVKTGGGYRLVYTDYLNFKGDIYLYPEKRGDLSKKGAFEHVHNAYVDGRTKLVVTVDDKTFEFMLSYYDGNIGTTRAVVGPNHRGMLIENLTDKYKPEYNNLEKVTVHQIYKNIY